MTDLSRRTILITGATSGIGLEASVRLAGTGAEVVMVARDGARLEAAAAAVKARAGTPRVEALVCDFSSQAAIRALAAEFQARHARLDVLVNNAGGVSRRRALTADGLERTFAVNHLGYFLLTNLLLEVVKRSAPARIVTVASAAHRSTSLDLEDLQLQKGYGMLRAYARSKLCNVLFSNELARRLAGTGVTANCLHPGVVATGIWSGARGLARPLLSIARRFMLTPGQGADAIVQLATSPELEGRSGGYYEKKRLVPPSAQARDQALARRLWEASARLTGLA